MSYALIIVDVQYDFLPGGALAVPNGDRVLTPLRNLALGADLVVASRDWHPENHFSFSDDPQWVDGSWPPHCVQRTRGAKIHPSLAKYADHTISKGMNRNPPDNYSAFDGKTLRPVQTLEAILAEHLIVDGVLDVVVGGLAEDYCVRFTALDATALGYRTIVPLDATAGVAPESTAEAHRAFEKAGVEVVDHYQ